MTSKHSLGKGLGAMFPDLLGQIQEKRSFVLCGIEELTPNPYQPRRRFDDREQKQLIASIRKSGIIQPIIVRRADKGYEIIAGERRWRGAQAAGLKDVPIIIREADDREVAELSLIENIQREALNPIEEAHAYETLNGRFGLSQEDIAGRVGKDRTTITNTLRLLKLHEEVQDALIKKAITAGHARALLALDIREEQSRTLRLIQQKGMNVRETEKLIQRLRSRTPDQKAGLPAPSPKRDPHVGEVERQLSKRFLTAVQVRQNRGDGTIVFKFKSGDELQRLLNLLMGDGP